MRFKIKSKILKGFTLIEATIAIFVLIIGLTAVTQLFPFSLKISGDSQNITTASVIALEKIEEMRASNYDDITVGTIEVKHRMSADPTNYLYNYQRETAVAAVDGNLNNSPTDVGLKKIIVTVFWQSPLKKTAEKSIQLTTLISER